jgi:hypothetical protein
MVKNQDRCEKKKSERDTVGSYVLRNIPRSMVVIVQVGHSDTVREAVDHLLSLTAIDRIGTFIIVLYVTFVVISAHLVCHVKRVFHPPIGLLVGRCWFRSDCSRLLLLDSTWILLLLRFLDSQDRLVWQWNRRRVLDGRRGRGKIRDRREIGSRQGLRF